VEERGSRHLRRLVGSVALHPPYVLVIEGSLEHLLQAWSERMLRPTWCFDTADMPCPRMLLG
jgi:hypothetical protein